MAGSLTVPTVLGALAGGTQQVSLIDGNFTPLYAALNLLNTFSNYYVDSGSADAYVVTCTAAQNATLAAGLMIQFKALNANTGASTLNVNGTGILNLVNPDGSALLPGQIAAGAIVIAIYDGTKYQVVTALGDPKFFIGSLTRTLADGTADVPYTGYGFSPAALIFFGAYDASELWSVGFDNGIIHSCIYHDNTPVAHTASIYSIVIQDSGGNGQHAIVKSRDADGFTLTWTKTGAFGGGGALINVLALR